MVSKRDFFGFETGELIFHLPFDSAKEFLGPEVTREEYKQMSCKRDDIVARMLDYMPFAWEKANGCRGISASRSMSHFTSWVWLSGNTQPYKETIKEHGFKWSRNKSKWYKAPYELKGKKRKGTNFDKIKSTYGYESKKMSGSKSLA